MSPKSIRRLSSHKSVCDKRLSKFNVAGLSPLYYGFNSNLRGTNEKTCSEMVNSQKIKTFMWFDDQAEEAAQHYVGGFKESKIDHITRQGAKAFVVNFTLAGLQYVALNGGPMFKPTEAFSLAVTCEDQSEVDRLW